MKKPLEYYFLLGLLAVLSINGIAGGVLMMISPDGALLEMELSWLENSPFRSFLFPGVLLFVFNGMLPAAALIGLIMNRNYAILQKLNIFQDKFWGWTFSLYSGITTLIWIIVQQLLTSFFILQPIISSFGVLIVIGTLMPRVQQRFSFPTRNEGLLNKIEIPNH